tara:strand:+ start:1591 stop:2097 length:507 start_codon:yes stop_codon:yes gene_type:complete
MGQEFFINSQALEDKIRKSLPSQGGQGAGFDLSASTQIIPIIDVTETAEGSTLREDLQSSLSATTITPFAVSNATNTVIINNTGYFRVFGQSATTGSGVSSMNILDGSTSKDIFTFFSLGGDERFESYDFIVFMEAGDSLRVTSNSTSANVSGITRQIADINGDLVNP